MRNLTKLMLSIPVIVTNVFSGGGQFSLNEGGTIFDKSILQINGTASVGAGKTVDVYGVIRGSGTVNCGEGAQIIIHGDSYATDATNADAIRTATKSSATTIHTFKEEDSGYIEESIAVYPATSLIKPNPDLCSYAADLSSSDLIYVANLDGSSVKFTGGETDPAGITVALANTDAGIEALKPASLVVEKKVVFAGNNLGFTEGTVSYGSLSNPAEVEITHSDALFPVVSSIEPGSKLTIKDGALMQKNMIVKSGRKYRLNETENEIILGNEDGKLILDCPLRLTAGTTLIIGTDEPTAICQFPYEYPMVMSWPADAFSGELAEQVSYSHCSGIGKTYPIEFVDKYTCEVAYTCECEFQGVFIYHEALNTWNVEQLTLTPINGTDDPPVLANYELDVDFDEDGKQQMNILTLCLYSEKHGIGTLHISDFGFEHANADLIEKKMGDGIFGYELQDETWNRTHKHLILPSKAKKFWDGNGDYVAVCSEDETKLLRIKFADKLLRCEVYKIDGKQARLTKIIGALKTIEGNKDTGYYVSDASMTEDEEIKFVVDNVAAYGFEKIWHDRETYMALKDYKFLGAEIINIDD